MNYLLKDLMKIAFDAGINAGIIEAGHQLNMMQDIPQQTFEKMLEHPSVKLLCELVSDKIDRDKTIIKISDAIETDALGNCFSDADPGL